MELNKREVIKFLEWLRNGFAFGTTWLLILMLVIKVVSGRQTLSVNSLLWMMGLVLGGTVIFCLAFTGLVIKKWNFTKRLTAFMFVFCVFECAVFYQIGIFVMQGNLLQWLIFGMIVFGLYLGCLALYEVYSRKQGALYTQALAGYQRKNTEK